MEPSICIHKHLFLSLLCPPLLCWGTAAPHRGCTDHHSLRRAPGPQQTHEQQALQVESPRWSRTAVGVRLQRRPGAPLQRLHCPPPATSTTVTYSAWRCYPNTTWRTRARETCVLLTSSAGSSRTRRPDMSTAACRPRLRALAALLPMNSTLVHGGTSALAHLLKTTPRREGRRVGVGESERTQTRAPPQQCHQARLLPPPQARRCS